MFGLVRVREERRASPQVIGGVRFFAAAVRPGEGFPARLSARAAARSLRRAGIREALLPPDFPHEELFAAYGVRRISPAPLHRAAAAALARQWLAQHAVDPRGAVVCFAADHMTAELHAAVFALAADVRFVALAVPNAAPLVEALRRKRGIAARPVASGEPSCADLTLCFDPGGASGNVLPLYDPALPVEYILPEGLAVPQGVVPNELLAALWRAGALRVETLTVRHVDKE